MNSTIIFSVSLPTLTSFKQAAKQLLSVVAIVVWAHIALSLLFPPC